jgi:membrane fusion protein (multidrug efflux system)
MEANKQPKKKWKMYILSGVVLGAGVIGLSAYVSGSKTVSTDNAQIDGNVVPVRTSVSGYVKEIRFVENSPVKKGDTLLIIDDQDLRARLQQAEAALENARAAQKLAQDGVQTAGLNANVSSLNSEAQTRVWRAQEDYNRSLSLFKSEATTQQKLDMADAELRTAKAQLAVVLKQIDASSKQASSARSQAEAQKDQVMLAQAVVKQREAEYQLAYLQWQYTFIKAPFDGVISKKSAEAGQFLAAGSPVCSAVDIQHVWVTANFKETQIAPVRAGQEVDVHLDAYPDVVLKGKVVSFSGATGAKFSLLPPDNATGNFVKVTQRVPVRIELEPNRDSSVYIAPGFSANVEIKVK